MKKSLLVMSSLILVFSVAFTACGKKTEFSDKFGNTHVAYTDKKGNLKQDEFGNLYEVVSDIDGKTRTQIYDFPEVMTNKRNTWIENGVLRMNVPKGWRTSGQTQKMILYHSGECTDTGTPHCELNFRYEKMRSLQYVYDEYLGTVKYLTMYSGECSDLKEYETKLFGITVKAISYHLDSTDVDCYCYFVQKEIPVISIEAYAYEPCYTEEELIALLNENCELKDLGGEAPTSENASSTTTTTAAASATETTKGK